MAFSEGDAGEPLEGINTLWVCDAEMLKQYARNSAGKHSAGHAV